MVQNQAKELLQFENTKWWEWIPIFGTIAFIMRIEIWKNQQSKTFRKNFGFYRTIWNLTFLVIGFAFLIVFFVCRNKFGFGPFPWFFFVGLGIGLGNNITLIVPLYLFKQGLKKYEKYLEVHPEAKSEVCEFNDLIPSNDDCQGVPTESDVHDSSENDHSSEESNESENK